MILTPLGGLGIFFPPCMCGAWKPRERSEAAKRFARLSIICAKHGWLSPDCYPGLETLICRFEKTLGRFAIAERRDDRRGTVLVAGEYNAPN